jgi:hypothetical protein
VKTYLDRYGIPWSDWEEERPTGEANDTRPTLA